MSQTSNIYNALTAHTDLSDPSYNSARHFNAEISEWAQCIH